MSPRRSGGSDRSPIRHSTADARGGQSLILLYSCHHRPVSAFQESDRTRISRRLRFLKIERGYLVWRDGRRGWAAPIGRMNPDGDATSKRASVRRHRRAQGGSPMRRSIRPTRASEQPRSAAAAALSASELRETGIAAAVCCSDWFGLIIWHAPLSVAAYLMRSQTNSVVRMAPPTDDGGVTSVS